MTTTTSLLCQQCTVGTVESFHQNIRRSEKRPLNWSPSSALLKLKCQHHHYLCGTLWKLQSSSRRNIIKCASATEKEPTVETASKVLEQGTQQQAQQPMQQQQQARARFVPRTFTVANEELVVGKVLTGKVKAIMTFGAFIDLGARIDGLLHISKMGAGFVKNVEDVVQMGQELQVQIIDADIENKRVKLKVYNAPDPTRSNATGAAPRKVAGQGAPKPVGVSSVKKTSQYKRGQAITGVVKNLTQRGCFVQLPGGEEGFLSSTELPTLDSKLQVGKEVNVKVLRVIDGRLTLTAKEETDLKKINEELNKDVFATNAFEVAFRKSAVIMKLLDESKKLAAAKEEAVVAATGLGEQLNVVEGATPESEVKKIQDAEPENSSKVEVTAEEEKLKDSAPELANEQAELKKTVEDSVAQAVEETEAEVSIAELASEAKENAVEAEPKVKPAEDVAPVGTSQDIKAPDANTSAEDVTEKYPETEANAAAGKAVDPVSEAEASLEIVVPEINATAEDVVKKDLGSDASQDMKAPEANAEAEDTADEPEPSQDIKVPEATADRDPVTELEPSQDLKVPATTADRDPVTEPEPSQDIKIPEADAEAENAAEVPLTEAEASQKVAAAETEVKTVSEAHVSIKNDVNGITSAAVKKLREQSGAGMMDCKKALVETNGDMEKAAEHLRKKGLAGADKKANRIAAEGAIGSYVHDGRIGVLFEVNSETDFVARGEIFTQLVEDLGMQIAASEQVEFVSVDDIPAELKQKEFDIEMQREDLQSKPEAIRAKIVEGRVAKRLSELALLEQPFIKNDGIFVKDLVKQTIATVGEKIQVRRFTKYVLGEGLEKRKHDLAAEVAEQSQAKEKKPEADVKVEADQQVNNKVGDDDVSISAALVKQLRGETGTGMMDCKKALKEVKGNYEEAKEYLRKKGLASAEKKVGRVTAEGAIVSYVHSGRIGVLIEVNTETDFVARNSVFRELAEDLAMQVVANPQVEYVSIEDVPAAVREKEMEIELQREDLLSKPEHIRGKIVEGRVSKLMSERALLEQPFLKDDTVLVKDVLKKATTTLGEHIRLRRFVRYTLGEGIRKKSSNFAEEVAAQVKAC